jgi:hypothetical protein
MSSAGRQLIAQRQSNLRAAISGRLNQLFPEARQGVGATGAEGLRNPAVINTYKSLQAIDKALTQAFADPPLSASARVKLRNAVTVQMNRASEREHINPPLMQNPARMQEKLTQMMGNGSFEATRKLLAQPALIQQNNVDLRPRMADSFKEYFAEKEPQINADTGIYGAFVVDTNREPVTINGVAHELVPATENLTENIPNARARGMVTMLCSQSGGSRDLGLLMAGLHEIEGADPVFVRARKPGYSITIQDGYVEVKASVEAYGSISENEEPVVNNHLIPLFKYEATYRLPINQPAPPAAPTVECLGVTTTPIP